MITRANNVTIHVGDQERALAFYRDRLGFEVREDAPTPDRLQHSILPLPVAMRQFGK